MENKQLGQRIANLRKEKNLSQKDLADKLCVSNKTISKWECGNGSPDIEILNKMSEIFNITLDEFINNKNDGNEKNMQRNHVVSKKSFNKKALIFTLIPISIVLLITISFMCYLFIPRNPQIENSNIFKVDNKSSTLFCTVSNETDFISLVDSLDLPLTNKWELYSDVNATNRINSKAVNLNVGDNIYYVLVKNNGGKQKIYELKIRRKPLYLISFNSNGGTQIDSILIEEGNLIDLSDIINPYLEGYTFAGWDYSFDNKVYEDTTLNAIWNANTYKIVYKSNTAIEDVEQIVYFNNGVELYSNVFNRNHYNLYKWNTKADGTGTNYSLSQNISKYNNPDDLILYAIWKPVTYNITYYLNEGVNNNQNIKSYNIESHDFTLLEPTKIGYDFNGWFKDWDLKYPIETVEKGSFGNLSLYAKWTPHQYTINYDLLGGTNNIINPAIYTIETDTITLQDPDKIGYTFDGWKEGSEIVKGTIGDLSFTAQWALIDYKINYILNGGLNNPLNPNTYTVESETITLKDPEKTGYKFLGWEEGNTIIAGSYTEKTFTAKWEIVTYNISYVLNDGDINPNAIYKTYTIESDNIILNAAEDETMIFQGWYLNRDFIGDSIDAIQTGTHGDLTLYAKWHTLLDGTQNEDGYFIIDSIGYYITITQNNLMWSKNYILNRDLDFDNRILTSIGIPYDPYIGNFNGNGKTLSNFNYQDSKNMGVFGCIKDNTIENLKVKANDIEYISTTSYAVFIGGIVFEANNSTIKNCICSTNIYLSTQSYSGIGGILFKGNDSKIISCYTTGNFTAIGKTYGYVGGILGLSSHYYTNNTVDNCFSTGNLKNNGHEPDVSIIIKAGTIYGSRDYRSSTLNINSCYQNMDQIINDKIVAYEEEDLMSLTLDEIIGRISTLWDNNIWNFNANNLPTLK